MGNEARIIDHNSIEYRKKWNELGSSRYNGAYFYSREIVKNIIPNVHTNRPWVTIRVGEKCMDRAIVFIHNNINSAERYKFLEKYNDLILVCGIPETVDKVKHLGKAIYLPLSIDVDFVKSFYVEDKTKGKAFVGRACKHRGIDLPDGIDYLENMPRNKLLFEMANYKEVYAVGRTAIEAKALGCRIRAYDPRFPDTRRWKVVDNLEAAKRLQKEIDKIDG